MEDLPYLEKFLSEHFRKISDQKFDLGIFGRRLRQVRL